MSLVVKAGQLLDGLGGEPLQDAVVVIDAGKIVACGAQSDISLPQDAEVVEAPKGTLMPGMIDCHVHVASFSLDVREILMTRPTCALFLAARNLEQTLRAGFTTVRDAGGSDPGLRDAVDRGLISGPRLLVAGAVGQTGTHLDSYYPSGVRVRDFGSAATRICDGPDEARRAVRSVMREGFDLVKICTTGGVTSPQDSPNSTELTVEEIRAIVETAASYGRPVMAHAAAGEGIKNAMRGGVRSIEHGTILDDEAIEMLLETASYLVPTLSVRRWVMGHAQELGIPEEMVKKAIPDSVKLDGLWKAVAAGVKIASGSDALAGMHGHNAMELQLLVEQAGLSPMQAIVAATRTAAELCRVADRVGTIEVGKLADLVLVDGDPLDDICILQDDSRLTVFKGGQRYVPRMS